MLHADDPFVEASLLMLLLLPSPNDTFSMCCCRLRGAAEGLMGNAEAGSPPAAAASPPAAAAAAPAKGSTTAITAPKSCRNGLLLADRQLPPPRWLPCPSLSELSLTPSSRMPSRRTECTAWSASPSSLSFPSPACGGGPSRGFSAPGSALVAAAAATPVPAAAAPAPAPAGAGVGARPGRSSPRPPTREEEEEEEDTPAPSPSPSSSPPSSPAPKPPMPPLPLCRSARRPPGDPSDTAGPPEISDPDVFTTGVAVGGSGASYLAPASPSGLAVPAPGNTRARGFDRAGGGALSMLVLLSSDFSPRPFSPGDLLLLLPPATSDLDELRPDAVLVSAPRALTAR